MLPKRKREAATATTENFIVGYALALDIERAEESKGKRYRLQATLAL